MYNRVILILWQLLLISHPHVSQIPEIVIQEGHSNEITTMALSPNNNYLITGEIGGHDQAVIKVWDMATKKLFRTINDPSLQYQSGEFQFTSVNDQIAISTENVWAIWNYKSGKKIEGDFNSGLALYNSGKITYENELNSDSSQIALWDNNYRLKKLYLFHDRIASLKIDNSRNWMIIGKYTGEVEIRDLHSFESIARFRDFISPIRKIIFIPESSKFIYSCYDCNKIVIRSLIDFTSNTVSFTREKFHVNSHNKELSLKQMVFDNYETEWNGELVFEDVDMSNLALRNNEFSNKENSMGIVNLKYCPIKRIIAIQHGFHKISLYSLFHNNISHVISPTKHCITSLTFTNSDNPLLIYASTKLNYDLDKQEINFINYINNIHVEKIEQRFVYSQQVNYFKNSHEYNKVINRSIYHISHLKENKRLQIAKSHYFSVDNNFDAIAVIEVGDSSKIEKSVDVLDLKTIESLFSYTIKKGETVLRIIKNKSIIICYNRFTNKLTIYKPGNKTESFKVFRDYPIIEISDNGEYMAYQEKIDETIYITAIRIKDLRQIFRSPIKGAYYTDYKFLDNSNTLVHSDSGKTGNSTILYLSNLSSTNESEIVEIDLYFQRFNISPNEKIIALEIPSPLVWDRGFHSKNHISEKNRIVDNFHTRILALDFNTFEKIAYFSTNQNYILNFEFSFDNKYLQINGTNSTELWDIRNTKRIYNSFNFPEGNIIFSDSFYYSQKNVLNNLAFRFQERSYPLEQFDLILNRPDKVAELLPNSNQRINLIYQMAINKRLGQKNKYINNYPNFLQVPEIFSISKNLPNNTDNSSIAIKIAAIDTLQKLDRVLVWINDVPIKGEDGINIRENNSHFWEDTIKLNLSSGENKIQFSVLNQAGQASLKETINITYNSPDRKPNLHLLTIGVQNFSNENLNLNYPIKDLQDVEYLIQKNKFKYNNIYSYSLRNSEFNLANLALIKENLYKSHVDDHIIIFVAGHGILDSDFNYYIATPNTDFSQPSVNGIHYDEIENLLDGIPARHKLLLIDACHSGEIDKSETEMVKNKFNNNGNLKFRAFENIPKPKHLGLQNSFQLMRELFVDLRRGTGASVISSASGVEFAWESDKWNNSVFTYSLLSGLSEKKADLNADGKIMITELQSYLANEVSQLTKGLQQPTFRLQNISNDWQIW